MIKLTFQKISAWAVFVALLLTSCPNEERLEEETDSFRTTINIHLNAITSRNLEELRPTVANNVSMISPDGDKGDKMDSIERKTS